MLRIKIVMHYVVVSGSNLGASAPSLCMVMARASHSSIWFHYQIRRAVLYIWDIRKLSFPVNEMPHDIHCTWSSNPGNSIHVNIMHTIIVYVTPSFITSASIGCCSKMINYHQPPPSCWRLQVMHQKASNAWFYAGYEWACFRIRTWSKECRQAAGGTTPIDNRDCHGNQK